MPADLHDRGAFDDSSDESTVTDQPPTGAQHDRVEPHAGAGVAIERPRDPSAGRLEREGRLIPPDHLGVGEGPGDVIRIVCRELTHDKALGLDGKAHPERRVTR